MNKTLPYKVNFKCFCCEKIGLKIVLDLNDQPLANSYLKEKTEAEFRYPLKLAYCNACTHLQLDAAVDPDLLFKNYLYVSGTTETLRNYFSSFVDLTREYNQGADVLDIACNDGSQLDAFKDRGYNTMGIDPAENLYPISSKKHEIICNYFNDETVNAINKTFDVIIAQNVFAHVRKPFEFLESCKKILKPGGHIFIQTSQADMVHNNEFDTVYHEHLSFFSVRSFSRLVERAGLNLIDVKRTPIHGTSFVFVVSNSGEDRSIELVRKEKPLNIDVLREYSVRAKKIAFQAKLKIDTYRRLGYKAVGYGAAAKGNTFLNFGNIELDYIVDDNPLKQGLYTPGRRIPIRSPHLIGLETTKILLVPLAWNFFEEIKNKVKNIKETDVKYLKYFPEVEIFDA